MAIAIKAQRGMRKGRNRTGGESREAREQKNYLEFYKNAEEIWQGHIFWYCVLAKMAK